MPMPLSGPARAVRRARLQGRPDVRRRAQRQGRRARPQDRAARRATPRRDANEAVRVARELILKENVDFLVGTLTSAEGPAVSVVAKENKIVFIAPIPKTDQLTAADKLHPYVFRVAANTTMEGRSAAEIVAKWPVTKVATISLRLRLRPGRDQVLRRAHQEDQAERADRGPAVAQARRAGLQPVHQRPDGQEARGDRSRRIWGGFFVTYAKQAKAARLLRRRQVQLHRPGRGGLAGDHQVDGRRLPGRHLGQLLRRLLLGRDAGPPRLHRAALAST